jgi:hypothetical protein
VPTQPTTGTKPSRPFNNLSLKKERAAAEYAATTTKNHLYQMQPSKLSKTTNIIGRVVSQAKSLSQIQEGGEKTCYRKSIKIVSSK